MPKVSVVIPSYNHAAYIDEAVRSVLNQTEQDLELIVIDDGSTDKSLEVLGRIKDTRLRVIPQENAGAHAAINRGLQESRADYLAVLNSDDAYHPYRLEKCLQVLAADERVGLVGSFVEVIDSHGKTLGVKHAYKDLSPWTLPSPERSFRAGANLRAALLTENYLSTTSNYVFRQSWFEYVGAFRPLRYAHDWDFALRLAHCSRLAVLPEPLLRYRVHSSNTIRENQAAMIFEICWILAVHLPEVMGTQEGMANSGAGLESVLHDFSPAGRAEALLHSIYTFDCERVLNVLLVQALHQDLAHALTLLEPGQAEREAYIQFIREQLATREAAQTSSGNTVQDSSGIAHTWNTAAQWVQELSGRWPGRQAARNLLARTEQFVHSHLHR